MPPGRIAIQRTERGWPMTFLKRFPSYDRLLQGAWQALQRFPLSLLCAMVGTGLAVSLVGNSDDDSTRVLVRWLLIMALGLPLFFSLATLAESRGWTKARSWLVQAGGGALLALFFFSLPPDVSRFHEPLLRFALLMIGLHFLVAFVPYLHHGQLNGFWQYNKSLFLRILLSALYSAVLYLGLAAALAAADYLFGADVPPDRYFQLWIIIVGTFNTWLFLAGVPQDLKGLSASSAYPIGLKVFTQFILLPLVGLYFLILFAYELKIIIAWNWPKGWVSNMVLWYSVVGILSMLLLHPLRELTENKWIQVFFRWFFRALVPLVVMLFLAITVRISNYGVTENRYFVLVMAIGLALVMLYFIFSKAKDIRIVPIVLCVIAFVSAYGPWSAFAVSERSQRARLMSYLAASDTTAAAPTQSGTDVAPDRVGEKSDRAESRRDYVEMSSIVRYLTEWHGLEPFKGIVADSALAGMDSLGTYARAEAIAQHLDFELTYTTADLPGGRFYFGWVVETPEPINIADYDLMLAFDDQARITEPRFVPLGEDSLWVRYDSLSSDIMVARWHGADTTGQLRINLTGAIDMSDESRRRYRRDQDEMRYRADGDRMSAELVVQRLSGYWHADSLSITGLTGQLLLKLEESPGGKQ